MVENYLALLPEELLQQTLGYLDKLDKLTLFQLCLVSKWTNSKAMPLLWQEVELVDCRSLHEGMTVSDEHDDTPIIRKLITLASNPRVASAVHTLTHRCHLPAPAVFGELPCTRFQGITLSHDYRTLHFLKLACRNMTNISTLRVIFGHWLLTAGLIEGVLATSRKRERPLKRLWLESCSLTGIAAKEISAAGIESLRFRRMHLLPGAGQAYVHCRGLATETRRDGQGWKYMASVCVLAREEYLVKRAWHSYGDRFGEGANLLTGHFEYANTFDDLIYNRIQQDINSDLPIMRSKPMDHRDRAMFNAGRVMDAFDSWQPTYLNDRITVETLLKGSAATLTSLSIDWCLLNTPKPDKISNGTGHFFRDLFQLKFPHLLAFQLANAVVEECQLGPEYFLLDEWPEKIHSSSLWAYSRKNIAIDFMAAHPKLQCLGWPMENFFNHTSPSGTERPPAVQKIIKNLARNLTELRVDTMYTTSGEFRTAETSDDAMAHGNCLSRRLFIEDFAAKMQKIKVLKMEGSIPRDERRETLRALGSCALEKIVNIAVNSPYGNTWGPMGLDLIAAEPEVDEVVRGGDMSTLEDENLAAITKLGAREPLRPAGIQEFDAEYGWPPSAPLLHTMATYHADTVTELKFCGYRGAAPLWISTPAIVPLLRPLVHFHNLRSLKLSLWMNTDYWGMAFGNKITLYWMKHPSCTPLTFVADVGPDHPSSRVAEQFEPSRIATRIKDLVGPVLSERAKARNGGVHVRGTFNIDEELGGLFDLDLHIGKAPDGEDVLLDWVGPREESHPDKQREKLERRRWF